MENGLPHYKYNVDQIKSRIMMNKRMKYADNSHPHLHVKIVSAEGIDEPSLHPSITEKAYCVVFWLHPGSEYETDIVEVSTDYSELVWSTRFVFCLDKDPNKYEFLNLEVVRIGSTTDPGTSTGITIVGRAKVPLPKEFDYEEIGRYELERSTDEEKSSQAEGHIILSMEFKMCNDFCVAYN